PAEPVLSKTLACCRTTKMRMALSAFTMAEILLSLTIIGVVAAITLPSLTGNINERTWNTQRKALYARMSQALPLMDALNGYGTYVAASGTEGTDSYVAGTDNAAETFVTAGLAKVLKINNICSDKLEDCGIPAEINTLGGNKISTPTTMQALNDKMVGSFAGGFFNSFTMLNTKAAAFETANGESIIVYYNPSCSGTLNETPFDQNGSGGVIRVQRRVCANFIYDLNGSKGPNTVGKDIGFMTVMYPFDALLYSVYPANRPLALVSGKKVSKLCTDFDSEYRAPNLDELLVMFVNKNLIDAESHSVVTSGLMAPASDTMRYANGNKAGVGQSLVSGYQDDDTRTGTWCVKR
ncbi:MAG: type II secretion system GspH family protein, partial [Fusobacterium sp.]|nr:type II secretion system GspH family protein [Fusobacterium sp.]